MNKNHNLKTTRQFFNDIKSGNKKFEVRFNDRDFKVGDTLNLYEINKKLNATGRTLFKKIIYILDDANFCKEGYVILGIEDVYGKDGQSE